LPTEKAASKDVLLSGDGIQYCVEAESGLLDLKKEARPWN